MKKSIRNIIVLFAVAVGLAAYHRTRTAKRGSFVRALSFHDVPDADWFEELLDALSTHYAFISPGDFHEGRFAEDKINILLTFDDGYASWVEVAAPLLERRGIRALFFINSGLLDAADEEEHAKVFMRDRLLLSPKRPLTWEGARRLLDAGHTIGGHTKTHPRLWGLSAGDLREEIAGDKQVLEERLGVELRDFAYPFGTRGDYTEAAMLTAIDAGYSRIYTAEPGFYAGTAYAVPRTLLEAGQSPKEVRRWIEGGYDIFHQLKSVFPG